MKLFGTEMPVAKGRELHAGALSAVLDSGALRYVRLNDIEVLRAIAFLVRDENWGTFTPKISNLKVSQSRSGFTVRYVARCSDATRALDYEAEISCSADGLSEIFGQRDAGDRLSYQPDGLRRAASATGGRRDGRLPSSMSTEVEPRASSRP